MSRGRVPPPLLLCPGCRQFVKPEAVHCPHCAGLMKPMLAAASRRSMAERRQRRLVDGVERLMAKHAEMTDLVLEQLLDQPPG